MSVHITLTSNRTTIPDPVVLLTKIRTATNDPTASLVTFDGITAIGKKATNWTPAQIASAQDIFDTTAPVSPQVLAQRQIDAFPIELRALILALVDQINVLRSKLSPPLSNITPAQALNAIREKAAQL